jgi:hypothetical protein
MRKLLASLAITALFFTGRMAWRAFTDDPPAVEAEADASTEAAETDAWIDASFDDGTAAPARGWLSQPGNVLFEGDPRQVDALVEHLYANGAESVWFIDIGEFGGANVSAAIAAELPADPAARERILRTEAEFWQEEEPAEDVGQRFVAFSFD